MPKKKCRKNNAERENVEERNVEVINVEEKMLRNAHASIPRLARSVDFRKRS